MGGLEERFSFLESKGERALVSYLMVGYPSYDVSVKAFRTVLENGTDILEIGFPFSDPVADGPTIQTAHEIALRNGIRLKDVLRLSVDLREDFPGVPFLLMTYYNPVFRMGIEKFCGVCADAGIDGLIVPDLPPEECGDLKRTAEKKGLSLVLLASPTSTERRLKKIATLSDDMVYFVSVTGTTGAREELPLKRIEEKVRFLKDLGKRVVVGFGVSKKEHARRISSFADGVVVGSLLVRITSEGDISGLASAVRKLKEGTIIKDS
ncbi:MAG: tryptophan synthase subunit alpha [Aquificota bacterium]|nr:tryptophan synthase subunit alpha [Aquificota bacterium]